MRERRVGAGRRERGRDSIREILPEKLLSEKAGRAEQKGEGKAWCGEREGGKEMEGGGKDGTNVYDGVILILLNI